MTLDPPHMVVRNDNLSVNSPYWQQTYFGGAYGYGTVFRMNPITGAFIVMHAFTGRTDGAAPFASLIEGPFGDIYGTTAGGGASGTGVVFRIGIAADLPPNWATMSRRRRRCGTP